jgi:hypothetical protein
MFFYYFVFKVATRPAGKIYNAFEKYNFLPP